ncbi:hypothetical protein HZB01_00550 [Candidatus Woesearchaeota archaeon]|nr:hypothetical protein [Candidatus Woesearchaeota archaeon]
MDGTAQAVEIRRDSIKDFLLHRKSALLSQQAHYEHTILPATTVPREINLTIDEIIRGEREVRITEQALAKAQAVIEVFGELTQAASGSYYELGFVFLAKPGERFISDVYIPHTGAASHSECMFTLSEKDHQEMSSQGMIPYGWGHSHGVFNVFLSGQDKKNLEHVVTAYHHGIRRKLMVGERGGVEVVAHPTIVLNHVGQRYGAVQFDYDVVKGIDPVTGQFRKERKKNLVERIPIRVIGNGDSFYDVAIDREAIRKQLLYGYGKGGVELVDGALGGSGSGVLQAKGKKLSRLYAPAVAQQSEEHPRTKLSKYSLAMRDYYLPFLRSDKPSEQYAGIIAQILAGQYYGNKEVLKDGVTESAEKRIWRWQDRIEAVEAVYAHNRQDMRPSLLEPMWDIIGQNKYVQKKYAAELKNLRAVLGR